MIKNLDMNETLRDAEFKDERPIKTVEKIKEILKSHGIETEESWMDSGVPYCYSLLVRIEGTTFSTNGKGLTKEFALASGYGELMERLQLGYVGGADMQKSGNNFDVSSDVQVPAEDMLRRNKKWYEALSKRLYQYTKLQLSAEEILMQFADAEGKVRATPYFNITTGEKDFFPANLRNAVYTTNGCAAGNTMEEAMVQAISEIVERHYKMKIITEEITVPDIPEETLQKYKVAYDIIAYVRSKGFRVHVKDCSLGTKFPVVCVCFIDERSGRYHTHFGAYPVFEIALERALTESFQGRNIETVAKFDDFIYHSSDVYSAANICSELKVGISEKQPEFFVGQPKYEWHEDVGFTGKNNRELLREIIQFFADQGYEIIVRDGSHLGFPTCQVLIPGYSEILVYRLSQKRNEFRYSSYAAKTLRNPASAGMEDMLGLLLHTSQMDKLSEKVSGVQGFSAGARLFTVLSRQEEECLMVASLGYVYFALGKLEQVLKCVDTMLSLADREEEEALICLKRYLSLRLNRYDEDKAKKILTYFHRPETVNDLYSCLETKGNPLEKFTLHCDMSCGEACRLHKKCGLKRMLALLELVREKAGALDFEAFAGNLRGLTEG